MNKETYERLQMEVTRFDAEDVIATSEVEPPQLELGKYEYGIPFGI